MEFALISPIVLILICGSIELGNLLFARIVLEGALVDAARLATVSLETNQSQREAAMRTRIARVMAPFPIAPGRTIAVTTRVFRDFSSAYPEPYQDTNRNGRYDLGEPYTDRNQNGVWNDTTPVPLSTMGGPGDVVTITATYPRQLLFGFLANELSMPAIFNVTARTTVRNEAVVRSS